MREQQLGKPCKFCGGMMPSNSNVCPYCQKKQKKTSWITILIIVIAIPIYLVSCGTIFSSIVSVEDEDDMQQDSTESKQDNEENDANTDGEETDNIFTVGEYLETDDLKISYLSCEQYKSDNQFIQPKDGYVYYRLEFEFENIGDSDQYVSSWDFEGYADGYSMEQTYFDDDLSATLSSGKKAKGAVYFEVPSDSTEVTAEYEMNYWTEEKVVFVIK